MLLICTLTLAAMVSSFVLLDISEKTVDSTAEYEGTAVCDYALAASIISTTLFTFAVVGTLLYSFL